VTLEALNVEYVENSSTTDKLWNAQNSSCKKILYDDNDNDDDDDDDDDDEEKVEPEGTRRVCMDCWNVRASGRLNYTVARS